MKNRVILEGMVFNPKMDKTAEGIPYLRFVLAVSGQETGRNEQRTDYFPVQVSRYDLIDYFSAFVQNKDSIVVEGSLYSTFAVPHDGLLSNSAEVHLALPNDRLERL